ncbi:hypothetical protein SODG_006621 [Sodalis praecaptivus]
MSDDIIKKLQIENAVLTRLLTVLLSMLDEDKSAVVSKRLELISLLATKKRPSNDEAYHAQEQQIRTLCSGLLDNAREVSDRLKGVCKFFV